MTVVYRRDDLIEVLGLSRAIVRRLRRGDIKTIGQLLDGYGSGALLKIDSIGVGALAEIESCIASLQLADVDLAALQSVKAASLVQHDLERISQDIRQRVEQGFLDERACVGKMTLGSMLFFGREGREVEVWDGLEKVFLFSSVSDELRVLVELLSKDELFVLVSRYTLPQSPFREIAEYLSKSMETVRRIEADLPAKVKAVYGLSVPGVYMQTALFRAEFQGLGLSYASWLCDLQQGKFLANLTLPGLADVLWIDEAVLMLAVCEILGPVYPQFGIPKNLREALELFYRDSETSLWVETLFSRFSYYQKQSVYRYLRHFGAVSSAYLAKVFGYSLEDMRSILDMLSFIGVDEDWYVSKDYGLRYEANYDLFHRYLLKVFVVCGSLSIDGVLDLMKFILNGGVYWIPPADVMAQVLEFYGYSEENGCWSYPGTYDVGSLQVNEAEKVMLNSFLSWPIIPRVYLVEVVSKAGLHPQYAYIVLRTSPLFVEVADSMFALRGHSFGWDEIKQARKEFSV